MHFAKIASFSSSGTVFVCVDPNRISGDYVNISDVTGEDDCNAIDLSDLMDVHVVGAPDSTYFALGSNLTVECTLNTSSPCSSLYNFTESTRLVLMRFNKTVAEGRKSRPPRFRFVAHGEEFSTRKFQRVETFLCRALDESGIPLVDSMGNIEIHVTLNYCGKLLCIQSYLKDLKIILLLNKLYCRMSLYR